MAIIGGIHHFQTYPHGPWWISSKLENWWKLKTPKSSSGSDPHIFPIPIAICSSMGDYKYHQFHIKLVIHPIIFQLFVGLVYHPTWSWHILWRCPKFLSHGTPKASIWIRVRTAFREPGVELFRLVLLNSPLDIWRWAKDVNEIPKTIEKSAVFLVTMYKHIYIYK